MTDSELAGCKLLSEFMRRPCDDYVGLADWAETPDYLHDLNALNRVCRKLKDAGEGGILNAEIEDVCLRSARAWDGGDGYSWQACLTAEELFPIVVSAVEAVNKLNKEAKHA